MEDFFGIFAWNKLPGLGYAAHDRVRSASPTSGVHYVNRAGEVISSSTLSRQGTARLKHNATHPLLSNNLSEDEKATLIEFHDRVDELISAVPWNDPDVSIEEIVERNEAMKQIRKAANDCLQKLGIEYSTEELLQDR